MCLDFNMMKNQIVYEPFAFGQYTEPGGHIFNVNDRAVLRTATEEQLSWIVRRGEASGDTRMQATFKAYPMGARLIGALPAFIGLAVFIAVVLRGVRERNDLGVDDDDEDNGGEQGNNSGSGASNNEQEMLERGEAAAPAPPSGASSGGDGGATRASSNNNNDLQAAPVDGPEGAEDSRAGSGPQSVPATETTDGAPRTEELPAAEPIAPIPEPKPEPGPRK
jgi:hypothetical protein